MEKTLSNKLSFSGILLFKDLYLNVCKGPILKNVKSFLWELSHRYVNSVDILIKRAPWIVSAPGWCALCHKNIVSIMHLFITYDFTRTFWNKILVTFNYHMVFLNKPLILLLILFLGHPFSKEKAVLWQFFIKAFIWNNWLEWNRCIFEDKAVEFSCLWTSYLYIYHMV